MFFYKVLGKSLTRVSLLVSNPYVHSNFNFLCNLVPTSLSILGSSLAPSELLPIPHHTSQPSPCSWQFREQTMLFYAFIFCLHWSLCLAAFPDYKGRIENIQFGGIKFGSRCLFAGNAFENDHFFASSFSCIRNLCTLQSIFAICCVLKHFLNCSLGLPRWRTG